MRKAIVLALSLGIAAPAYAQEAPDRHFTVDDLFGLTVAADPQISPDGKQIAYVRRANDIMTDAAVSSIWMVDTASGAQTPLVTGAGAHFAPRWSPDGSRLAYVSTESGGGPELHVRWMASGESANITALPESPGSLSWSPDGTMIAYTARVPGKPVSLGKPASKPEGAQWKAPPAITDAVTYRFDGAGYLKPGYTQVFLVSATGGAPRQLTSGDRNHDGPIEWMPDGSALLISGNRDENWELAGLDTEVYAIDIASGAIRELTTRDGPDTSPQVSPDGRRIAYLGFDDEGRDAHMAGLYLMDSDGSNHRRIAAGFDRSFDSLEWTEAGIFAGYEDEGVYRVARISTSGSVDPLPARIAGPGYTRPYVGGQWSVSDRGNLAFTSGSATRPADVSVLRGNRPVQLTRLNEVFLSGKQLGETREIAVTMPDGKDIPSWILLPPDYVEGTRVPMILEIHGGPHAAYGPHFASDYQIYASAGYAVLFTNPSGSSGYGSQFLGGIDGTYPVPNDAELLAAVDAAVAAGYADPDNLFVTGGSGGGILTAWMVGKTDRFAAAASNKPVINWTTMALAADAYPFFARYWMKGMPWENPEGYWARSPLAAADKINTPTLVLVAAEDYRTPRFEAEQFYGALKLRGVDTALLVTPGGSHGDTTMSPSQLGAKTSAVVAWFDKYRTDSAAE
ncbi:alpha/beta hydrolase family protein [Qipengyuania aquimaris]|uniref:alpha/beta hydrolase family protein n=1 Tax=Qipengyuania aquimaris TaxID=255984 RepID=UPI001FD3B691|nr:S9 family peptidase [Qipengyuania aquimaris]UOR16188.1 S9 family peptidase [Qipengyuania aquimaris]